MRKKRKKKVFPRETIKLYPWMMDFYDEGIYKNDILVYATIYEIWLKKIRFTRSIRFLELNCKMNRKSTCESLKKLVDLGYLNKSEEPNSARNYSYTINVEKLQRGVKNAL